MSLLAIGWEPELRGLLTVVIGVVILCGSVYGILATNMGGRLAFLVSLTAIFGWMMLMGIVWSFYGIGLVGPAPSWQAVPGQGVLQDVDALGSAGVLEPNADVPDDATPAEASDIVADEFIEQGWVTLDPAEPAFGQAQAAATELLIEEGAFEAGQFQITRVFDTGGERYPKINESLDFLAFFHTPHYVVAEAASLVPVREEPGRAPALPVVDETRDAQYVYMIRDLGAVRQPAIVTAIGSAVIFFTLCWLLHRRDRVLKENLAKPLPPVEVEGPPPSDDTESADAAEREKVGAGT